MSAGLPRIVHFAEWLDAPGSCCPHCGADGRFIARFVCADGTARGAMRGCIKLFPVAPIAREELRLLEKRSRYVRQGWKLNRRDQEALDACEAVWRGEMQESIALSICKSAKMAAQSQYRTRRAS